VIGDRPPHDAPAERVEHDGQVHLALLGGVLGDVHHPKPVGCLGVEGPVHQIIRWLSIRVPAGASVAPAPVDPADPRFAHEALDALLSAPDAFAQAELGVDPGGPIAAP
jgi:hypothetical protein